MTPKIANSEHKSDSVNSAFSLRNKPVNERPKTLRKQHVNGEMWMVATKVGHKWVLKFAKTTRGKIASLHFLGICCNFRGHRKVAETFKERISSRGTKRNKLNGANGAEFAVFHRFSLILADFPFSWELQHFGGADFAENRRFSQETADFRRKRRNPLPNVVCPC